MKRLIILIKGGIPLFFLLWIFYFTTRSIYEYIYYIRLRSKMERDLLHLKAKIVVRESRIAFLKTETGGKIFLQRVYEEIKGH